jgi:predicted nucleic acid-binding protein
MSLYLADSSIWVARRQPGADTLRSAFIERFRRGEIATCVPIALEVLTAARDAEAYEEDWETVWKALFWLPLRERALQRALDLQRELAAAGGHRCSPATFLVAACALEASEAVVVWHCDPCIELICEHTGQPHELATGVTGAHAAA